MTKIFKTRCHELLTEVVKFQALIFQQKPKLKKNNQIHFTITLTKSKSVKCQYGEIIKLMNIEACTTNITLLKRLSYLSNHKKLEFAQDTENSNQFLVTVFNVVNPKSKASQLQLLF